MKADHIIVVMNGEIVESGSHQDLVQSQGKYHDLWSKQIFVTPDVERGPSKSPEKGEAHIINDLTASTKEIPLVKVMGDIESKGPTAPSETSLSQAEASNNTTTSSSKTKKRDYKHEVSSAEE